MKTKLVFVFALALLFVSSASAAPIIACTGTNLQDFLGLNVTGGCSYNGVIFSNFSYTVVPTTGGPSAAEVPTSVQSGNGMRGMLFGGTGGWPSPAVSSFQIGYTMTLTDVGQRWWVSALQVNRGRGSQFLVEMQETLDGTVLGNPLTTSDGNIHELEHQQARSIRVLNSATISSGQILSIENDFYFTSAVPEPAAFGLTASALLGLAVLLRRRRNNF